MEHNSMEVWKILFLSKLGDGCSFHVDLPGCISQMFTFDFFQGKRRGLISDTPGGELLSTKGTRATIIFVERCHVFGEWFPVTLAKHDESISIC